MEKASIAVASHITYQPPELMGLIADHLQASGFTEAAEALERELHIRRRTDVSGKRPGQAFLAGMFSTDQIASKGTVPWHCSTVDRLCY